MSLKPAFRYIAVLAERLLYLEQEAVPPRRGGFSYRGGPYRQVPVYAYRCTNGHHYEKTEGFDAPSEQPCMVCGRISRRQISLPAVIFKGPGFYSTDNRSSSWGGNGKSAETDSGSASSDEHGYSHADSGHSQRSESPPKAEAAAAD